jgi:hypothetical protein
MLKKKKIRKNDLRIQLQNKRTNKKKKKKIILMQN